MKHIHLFSLLLLVSTTITYTAENHLGSESVNITTTEKTLAFQKEFKKGCKCYREKKLDEAIEAYKKTVALNPNCHQAYLNMGICLHDKEKRFQARDALEKAIVIKPDYPKAHFHLANIMKKLGRMDDALAHYKVVIEHDKYFFDAYLERARILKDRHQFDKALKEVGAGLALQPEHIKLLFEKANILNTINEIEESLEIYLKLLEKMPTSRSLLYNTGYTLKKLGKNAEAEPYYDKLLTLYPDHVEGHFGYGLLCLSNGDFKTGWREYEWRWLRPDQRMKKHYTQFPEWDGCDLQNKVILLWAEQGLGDTFQFIRFAKCAKDQGGHVIVAVQSPLIDIVSSCPFIDQVIKLGQTPVHVDYQAPLMSIPYILKLEIEDIPFCDEPYFFADKHLEAEWATKLAHDTNFKIGICWQGNSNYSTPFLRAIVKQKSIPLEIMIRLADIPGVTLYNLQKMTGTDQITPKFKNKMVCFDGDFDNSNGRFMDTAAIINNLDLIITVDTSMCHISTGLCTTPVWNILPNPADWRWPINQLNTPWYKTMRLFKQPTPGDWESLINEVTHELIKLIEEKTGEKFATSIIKQNTNIKNNVKNIAQTKTKSSHDIIALQQQLEQQIAHVANSMLIIKQQITHTTKHNEDSFFAELVQSWIALHQLHEQLMRQYKHIV